MEDLCNSCSSDRFYSKEDEELTHEVPATGADVDVLSISSDDDAFEFIEERGNEKLDIDYIQPDDAKYPFSRYDGYKPPYPQVAERDIVKEFMNVIENRQNGSSNAVFGNEEFMEVDLIDFSIYLPGTIVHHPWELSGLQNLATKSSNSAYMFDGILCFSGARYYVEKVPFEICSIGNYGVKNDSVDGQIWIKSILNKRTDIFYRLKHPSMEYERFHTDFLWLADLAKHVVDYLLYMNDRIGKASIHDFKKNFGVWLDISHGSSSVYKKWYNQYGSHDFRRAVSAHIQFLFKEAIGIRDELRNHHLWNEVLTLDFIPEQTLQHEDTIVTPYVYDCFKHLESGKCLKSVTPIVDVGARRRSVGSSLHLTVEGNNPQMSQNATAKARKLSSSRSMSSNFDSRMVVVGDVFALDPEDETISRWKREGSRWKVADESWYIYIQAIHTTRDERREFDAIWLYRPSETTCAMMKYVYENELFFSDHCTCHESRIGEDELLFRASVDWKGSPEKSKDSFFIRQTYIATANSFVTFNSNHLRCSHYRDDTKTPLQELVDKYAVGDTVLVVPPPQLKSSYGLEPAVILEFIQEGDRGLVRLRHLQRCSHLYEDPNVSRQDRPLCLPRPNELVYTSEEYVVKAEKVHRSCHVRFFTQKNIIKREISTPYDRDGTGDAFYITCELTTCGNGNLMLREFKPEQYPSSVKLGFDPQAALARPKFRGMDLYCGGGTFGRGIEEGGAVHNKWAVDMAKNAIHSYHANLIDPEDTELFLGSVDDLLYQAFMGNPERSSLIPLPGDVDFISAGSPCTGFSNLNNLKDNNKGLKNQSLVASVAAYIDFYRPKYALLENVTTMASKGKGRDEDMLSQLICCLVGMGYQVQMFVLDSWSFGSPQSRSRLFVSIAAPGLDPPQHPGLSHSHPENTKDRGLGVMSNGQNFGIRRFDPTPFSYVTAGAATSDLPDIRDGATKVCISQPDHRMSKEIKESHRKRIEVIPLHPRGMNFYKTWKAGLLTKTERNLFPNIAKNGKIRQAAELGSRS